MHRISGAYLRQRLSSRFSSSTFRNYTHSEPRFRALLTEGDARTLFYRKEFDWLGEESV